MGVVNAAVQAIRDEDPNRPVLIGPPGHNDAEHLQFVSRDRLPYTFGGSGSFDNDPNMGVAIHFYEPRSGDNNWAMWIATLEGGWDWQGPIKAQIDYVNAWRTQASHADTPVVTTEWGCWMDHSRR